MQTPRLADQPSHAPTTGARAAAVDADIAELRRRVPEFKRRLGAIKAGISGIPFYPYETLGNLGQLDMLLTGGNRSLGRLAGGLPVADVGAADGDLAFFLESQGFDVHIVDNAPTNCNGLRGARAVAEALGSKVAIHDVDLDRQFALPEAEYGLVLFLGILYHLKNPYYALETLARRARHLVLSTRVAQLARPMPDAATTLDRALSRVGRLIERVAPRFAPPLGMRRIGELPVAYLVDPHECNNDATNFWIFTSEGLQRLLARTGWEILDYRTVGNTRRSDPATTEGDERAFCLARSRIFGA